MLNPPLDGKVRIVCPCTNTYEVHERELVLNQLDPDNPDRWSQLPQWRCTNCRKVKG